MSWDVYLTIDTGGEEPYYIDDASFNYTYNTSPMLYDVGINWRELTGKNAVEAVRVIREGIEKLRADPDKYEAMNPPNGWGSYSGLLETLDKLVEEWSKHPKGTVATWL